MKRVIKFLCIVCTLLLSCNAVCAEDAFDFTWKGNYTDMTLDITVKSPVKYTQDISVVMYPDGAPSPSVANYSRMLQSQLVGGNDVTVKIKIADDLQTVDGKYSVIVQGSGYASENSRKSDTEVYLFTPAQINGDGGLLSEFNAATSTTLEPSLVKVKNALSLSDVGSAEVSERSSEFIDVRTNDFSGAFTNLDGVRKAWECSDILVCLKNANATATELETKVEFCSELMGIDTSSDKYNTLKSQIYEKMLKIAKADGAVAIKSCEKIENIFNQATAVAAINSASMETIETEIKAYATALGISTAYIEKFDSITTTGDKDIVTRQLQGQGFNLPTEASKVFTDAVDAVLAKGTIPEGGTDDGDDGDSGSGSGGGGGGGGGKIPSVGIETIPEADKTPDTSGYADCRSGHWAFTYVDKLTKLGVVNGYDNGMFYPDKKVTREEFVKMIISATGLHNDEASCAFTDVSSQAWYYKYIASAVQTGIISGISAEEFGTGRNITREDAAVIAARSLKKMSKYPDYAVNKTEFGDNASISTYASESVAVLSGMNIINGYEDGSFKPQDNLTRAQAAKIISLIIE